NEQNPSEEKVVVAGGRSGDALRVGSLPLDKKESPFQKLLDVFLPNRVVSANTLRLIIAVQVAIFLGLWLNSPFEVLPKPNEVLEALQNLWLKQGLGPELITSFKVNLEALGLTLVISLIFSYLTVLPFFRPIAAAISKGRFLSLAGFTLIFTLLVGGGHPLKLSLLVFGMTVFFVTSMVSVIAEIPKEAYDHARTLRMSEWRVVWEIVVIGTGDKVFEVLRQNAAIGWMMLTMVEGISRSEGGVGAMLLNQNKYFKIPEVFAIQLAILLVGLFQDYLIGVLRRIVCPYAHLTLERA
ncbi:MAG TPA: ABC transporter permease subunit, partial [Fimbriimonas sp.]|nr:ABC transporter permease subunit [Fimbriimonas sp.]